jgi:hypothetical protein
MRDTIRPAACMPVDTDRLDRGEEAHGPTTTGRTSGSASVCAAGRAKETDSRHRHCAPRRGYRDGCLSRRPVHTAGRSVMGRATCRTDRIPPRVAPCTSRYRLIYMPHNLWSPSDGSEAYRSDAPICARSPVPDPDLPPGNWSSGKVAMDPFCGAPHSWSTNKLGFRPPVGRIVVVLPAIRGQWSSIECLNQLA